MLLYSRLKFVLDLRSLDNLNKDIFSNTYGSIDIFYVKGHPETSPNGAKTGTI